MTRQEAAIQYIETNYLQFNRLRYDVVGGKLQIRDADNRWREMSKQEINSAVCACAQEYQTNVSAREIITVLQSNIVPSVHPLREYVLSLQPYTPDQPDWIDWVAKQVKVRSGAPDRPSGCRSAQVPVDGRSAAPVDNAMLFSTASTTSDLQQCDPQCSASETIYSEQRERSKN